MYKVSLEAARVNKRLTQKEAARMLSVSNKTLGSWEKGASYPAADKLAKICTLYEVPYDHLIFLNADSL